MSFDYNVQPPEGTLDEQKKYSHPLIDHTRVRK